MWQHETIKPEDGSPPIEAERLTTYFTDLVIIHTEDGCNGEVEIGWYNDLDMAKRVAVGWLLYRIGDVLREIGAKGAWLLHGARQVSLAYELAGELLGLEIDDPAELVLLARFPTGSSIYIDTGIQHI